MRVLQIIPELDTGGAEQGCLDVAHALVKAGHASWVATARGRLLPALKQGGSCWIPFPADQKNPWRVYQNSRTLIRFIRHHQIDLIHARSRAPAWSTWLACRATGIPWVTTFHGTYTFHHQIKKLYNSIMTRSDRIIAISYFIAQHIAEHYQPDPQKVRIIPRGISFTHFDPQAVTPARQKALVAAWRLPDKPLILMPARLSSIKGHLILIEALAHLHREGLSFVTVLIGNPQGRLAYYEKLLKTITAHHLQKVVFIQDHCTDMPAAYSLAEVVVCPSIEPEAFGRIPVEAQAMGKPVVASDHGGFKETLLPEQTGWLYPPHDPKALAQALKKAFTLSPEDRVLWASRSRAHVQAIYTTERMCENTLSCYRELDSSE